jgi:hypothetical protein
MITGPDHAHVESQRVRRGGELHFFLEDVLLDGRPAGAAPFDGPVRDRPAFGVEDALPSDDVVLGRSLPEFRLAADVVRERLAKERPYFIAECQLFRRESQVHDPLLISLFVCSGGMDRL